MKKILNYVILLIAFVFVSCNDDSLNNDVLLPPVAGYSVRTAINVAFNPNSNTYTLDLPSKGSSYLSHPSKTEYHNIEMLEGIVFSKKINQKTKHISNIGYYRTKVIGKDLESQYGLIIDGKEVIKPYFTSLKVAHEIRIADEETLTPIIKACKDKKCNFYVGEKILPGTYQANQSIIGSSVSDNDCHLSTYQITSTPTVGYQDITDSWIVDFCNDNIRTFQEVDLDEDKVIAFIDKRTKVFSFDGTLIDEFPYSYVVPTKMEGVYLVGESIHEEDLYQPMKVVNSSNELLLPQARYDIRDTETVIGFSNSKTLGTILILDHRVTMFEQDKVDPITILSIPGPYRYVVGRRDKDNGGYKYGLMNQEGLLIKDTEFSSYEALGDGKISFTKDANVGVFNIHTGKLLHVKNVESEDWPDSW